MQSVIIETRVAGLPHVRCLLIAAGGMITPITSSGQMRVKLGCRHRWLLLAALGSCSNVALVAAPLWQCCLNGDARCVGASLAGDGKQAIAVEDAGSWHQLKPQESASSWSISLTDGTLADTSRRSKHHIRRE